MLRRFSQVDGFTDSAYHGNPCAVVVDGDGLDDRRMQRFAHWTNLSETTFVLPPTDPAADYRVRIFTPVAELPFAGHPTIGTCHAWLEAGGTAAVDGEIVQECGIGLVRIRQTADGLGFAADVRSDHASARPDRGGPRARHSQRIQQHGPAGSPV